MKSINSLFQQVRLFRGKKSRPDAFMEWPFYLILTFTFLFVYVQSIFSNAALRQPGRLILFSGLMIAHIVLHWTTVRLRTDRQVTVYLIVQCVLAFVLVYLAGSIGASLGLYLGLIGEMVGLLLGKPRWMVTALVAILGLSFMNYILLTGTANWSWWLLAVLPLTLIVAVLVSLYSRQAEARQRAQSLLLDLEAANRQLSEYAARVEDLSIASERQRMARELHDTLSQGLAGLILQLEAADAHLAGDRPERARSILQNSMEKARSTLADARLVIDDLRKPAAHDLVEAVEQEAGRFRAATGIEFEPLVEIGLEIPGLLSEIVLKVITEALTNIARHAHANHVTLRLTAAFEELVVEISDDGAGFNPEAVQAGHYGLLGVRERVRMAGGSMELASQVGKGTRIVIRFPLEEHVKE